jgi:hypothetical protein
LSSISPHTQKSHVTSQVAQNNEEVLDPFDELCHAKLSLMAEKTTNRFIMKEMLTQICLINDLLYRKQVQHEMLLHNESEIQIKTLIELSLTPNEAVLCQNLRRQIVEESRSKTNR